MMSHRTLRWLLLPAAALTVVACGTGDDSATQPSSELADLHAAHSVMITDAGEQLKGESLAWVARLRRESLKWKDADAMRAVYETELGCMEDETTGLGGMGIHLLDADRLATPVVDLQPEALMYEPQADGTLKLVGVEYVKSRAAFPEAPEIANVRFHAHPNGLLWILHVWVAEHNPSGIMKDWNPRVKCPAP